MQVYQAFNEAEEMPEIHTIVIDTLTFLMEMFESQFVIGVDGFEGWKQYYQYFKNLMQDYVAKSTKNVIILAHTNSKYNSEEMIKEVSVPIKGALKANGIESAFSMVISTKRMPLKDLAKYESEFLNITEDDLLLGYKYVFQTRLTKDTINERMRGPVSMWSVNETFIDNNIAFVLQRLNEFYADE